MIEIKKHTSNWVEITNGTNTFLLEAIDFDEMFVLKVYGTGPKSLSMKIKPKLESEIQLELPK